jgi:hypothetical protein
MPKQYLRKRRVAQRYDCSLRAVERNPRIPAPEYPIGPNIPMWNLEKLEAAERAAVLRKNKSGAGWRDRLISWVATSPRDQAVAILHEHKDLIDALSAPAREKLLAELQDAITEIPKEND